MKKLFILVALFAITVGAMAQLKVLPNGKVGIGMNSPVKTLDVQGTARFSIHGQSWDNVCLDANNQWGAPQLYCASANLMVGTEEHFVNCSYVNYFYYRNIYKWSDERLKEGIKPLGSTLNKILEIESKRYRYKKDTISDNIIPDFEKMSERETFGFIAQDLEKIFPELVLAPSSVNKYYSVDYIGMIPVLLEAIKEQQTQIDFMGDSLSSALEKTIKEQQVQIERLQKMISNYMYEITLLRDEIKACCQGNPKNLPPQQPPTMNENNNQEYNPLKNTSVDENNSQAIASAKLFQNVPNPFTINTEIRFEIPENSTSAKLLIHDMQGAEIKSYTITAKGIGNIIIQAHELPAGMYMYTLLVNNAIVDTKKMILTK